MQAPPTVATVYGSSRLGENRGQLRSWKRRRREERRPIEYFTESQIKKYWATLD